MSIEVTTNTDIVVNLSGGRDSTIDKAEECDPMIVGTHPLVSLKKGNYHPGLPIHRHCPRCLCDAAEICQTKQPYSIQGSEELQDLIHPQGPATKELFDHLGNLSPRERRAHHKAPRQCFLIEKRVGRIKESFEVFPQLIHNILSKGPSYFLFCLMEAPGCSHLLKMHLPELKDTREHLGPTAPDGVQERDKGGPRKTVTMAPTSSYLNERQYVTRKPLFCAEPHASILKRTTDLETEDQHHTNVTLWTRSREGLFPDSCSYLLPASAIPLTVSTVRGPLAHQQCSEGASVPCSRSIQGSPSSSILEAQRLNSPLRPQLSSAVLNPTCTPFSSSSRRGQTEIGKNKSHSCSFGQLSHQAKYWACAIPKSLPPSPDRQGAGWDPNREYQELMDYTYPLSPGQLKKDSLLQTDMTLQDSGIEMDHFFSSSSLYSRERGTPQPTSPTYPAGWSLDSLDGSMDKDEKNHCRDGGHHHRQPASTSSTCAAFFCSSRLITPYRCGCSIVDPEFQPLPDQLEELQQLSRQVREVTASWGSLDQGPTSILSSITLPKKHEQVSQDHGGREKTAASGDSEAMRSGPPAWMDSIGGGVSQSCLREVEALVEQLCGLGLQGRQTRSQKDLEQCYSLMQHVQVFGSHLEHLIQWLYTVSEKMELLALPTKDIDSVKMLLAEYQSFQRDVSSHQPLTSSVLQSGQLLLSCIGATSPVLADTLLLINRQSWMLETHMEHLFSSILSAMDSLTTVSQTNEDHQSEPEEANHHS